MIGPPYERQLLVTNSPEKTGSRNCKKTESVKALEDADPPYQYDSDASVHRVEVIEISRVQTTNNNLVTVHIKNTPVQLFIDSGCRKTLIPRKLYQSQMGPMKPTSTRFRPYGTHHHLSVLGQVSTTLVTESGAQHKTTVFITEGQAKSLGILCINSEGKTKKGSEMVAVKVVTSDLQAAGFTLNTCLEQDEEPTAAEKQRVEEILATTMGRESGIPRIGV